jgi:hypothetical protein
VTGWADAQVPSAEATSERPASVALRGTSANRVLHLVNHAQSRDSSKDPRFVKTRQWLLLVQLLFHW